MVKTQSSRLGRSPRCDPTYFNFRPLPTRFSQPQSHSAAMNSGSRKGSKSLLTVFKTSPAKFAKSNKDLRGDQRNSEKERVLTASSARFASTQCAGNITLGIGVHRALRAEELVVSPDQAIQIGKQSVELHSDYAISQDVQIGAMTTKEATPTSSQGIALVTRVLTSS